MESDPSTIIGIDLAAQTITLDGNSESFEINNYKKTCLLNGYDDIDYLLSIRGDIETFEQQLNP